jgi:hypothetical protein
MNKSAAPFCRRLYDSIGKQYGQEKADEVCGKGVGSSATGEQKGQWAAQAMGRLEASFGEAERAGLLAGCACGPTQRQLEHYGELYKSCRSLEEYAERKTAEWKGLARVEARDGMLYVSYPRCYCALVKNAANKIPRTFCLCSCEYTRRACEAAVGGSVEVKLLKSVVAGDDECLFEVRIL